MDGGFYPDPVGRHFGGWCGWLWFEQKEFGVGLGRGFLLFFYLSNLIKQLIIILNNSRHLLHHDLLLLLAKPKELLDRKELGLFLLLLLFQLFLIVLFLHLFDPLFSDLHYSRISIVFLLCFHSFLGLDGNLSHFLVLGLSVSSPDDVVFEVFFLIPGLELLFLDLTGNSSLELCVLRRELQELEHCLDLGILNLDL